MRWKYFDVWLRWRPHLTCRQLRRLEARLPICGLEVGVDGITGQSDKWPRAEDISGILGAVRSVRCTTDDVHGAIVPSGYGWRPVLETNFDGRGWRAWTGGRMICDALPLARGIGHEPGCGCHRTGSVNTDACIVAKAWAQTPPLVVLPED